MAELVSSLLVLVPTVRQGISASSSPGKVMKSLPVDEGRADTAEVANADHDSDTDTLLDITTGIVRRPGQKDGDSGVGAGAGEERAKVAILGLLGAEEDSETDDGDRLGEEDHRTTETLLVGNPGEEEGDAHGENVRGSGKELSVGILESEAGDDGGEEERKRVDGDAVTVEREHDRQLGGSTSTAYTRTRNTENPRVYSPEIDDSIHVRLPVLARSIDKVDGVVRGLALAVILEATENLLALALGQESRVFGKAMHAPESEHARKNGEGTLEKEDVSPASPAVIDHKLVTRSRGEA